MCGATALATTYCEKIPLYEENVLGSSARKDKPNIPIFYGETGSHFYNKLVDKHDAAPDAIYNPDHGMNSWDMGFLAGKDGRGTTAAG
ncbi:hypothetical protein PIB30_074969, partial [Stylosanthes scabra]|nr:hypothetical protein [Stylosanthes scabra]